MTLKQIMAQLEKWGSEKARDINKRHGAGDQQFGANRNNLRELAAQLKTNHELALELWRTGNIDAMLLATLLMAPEELSQSDIEKMIKSCTYFQLVDWFVGNVVKVTPFKDKLRTKWSASKDEYPGRAGWSRGRRRARASRCRRTWSRSSDLSRARPRGRSCSSRAS